ncbi:MAG: TIGR02453 family protein [Zetaproteobacteria bacterium CG12_big_fil_rev_8_21_14_0_65_54_13]|nr:MAG: TIGR02453 family protein [Zetaproteobacteria bacterium CG12_big_fil_rev_8_21_14_0_65_54_13]PIX54955.1 MAG: TIGR02453 family protein [Zetaproteobacteria bacterium CG_4_10_14_3_um_filter_54_28]PJA27530.1 MAG: TIGR02453 family protein [Zetaproteobacteria bacterium CG_4_9_14_3_um_filter_54_145]
MATHFTPATMAYLETLAANNNRDWFQEHKHRYEQDVREPALAFIEAVGARLPAIAPHFTADARKMGGSLMRVYRDSRFSKDKTPYKTNIGIQFRHEAGKDVHAPGYYLHVSPTECFIGAGIWHPPADALLKIRQFIVDEPELWLAARDDASFSRWFYLDGDSLKTAPRGFDKAHPLIEDIRRKDFIGISDIPAALIEQADLADIACDYFTAAAPMMQFLCRALRLPYQD